MSSDFDPESIPDEDVLYMRVHKTHSRGKGYNEIPAPGAFKDHGGGMSTNWCKYSDPDTTRRQKVNWQDFGVIALMVGKVRKIPQTVEHTPAPDNQAHTDVIGDKTAPSVRVRLSRLASWCEGFDPLYLGFLEEGSVE